MEHQASSIENLFEKTGDYLETRMELFKLKAVNTTSEITASILTKFIVGMVISLIILMLNVGIAIWIGDELGKIYYGFFIVSGFYIIVAILMYAFRRSWIKKPLNDMLINKMLN